MKPCEVVVSDTKYSHCEACKGRSATLYRIRIGEAIQLICSFCKSHITNDIKRIDANYLD